MVIIEVRGRLLRLAKEDAERLQSRAASQAGRSGRARDLALVLEWALTSTEIVSLRRGEANELSRLVNENDDLAPIAAQLAA